jgi:hypothetical protein
MKIAQFGTRLLVFWFALACGAPHFGLAQAQQQTPATPSSARAPTGTYVAYVDPQKKVSWQIPLFTLRLETNGTYSAQSTDTATKTSRGTWRWDVKQGQFRLEPGDFVYYIKCLPVDKQHTNRLVWGKSWLVREDNG